ncbi:hypothetical protein BDF22DRAFT_731402 [Syncephalis plumigaleata]|nr:hypothetical protein BDF22DRAFT_731402 [Syncephalis plumigaleata]
MDNLTEATATIMAATTECASPARVNGYNSVLQWPTVDMNKLGGSLPNFVSPPVFHGRPDEDPMNWLEAYERVARFNRWNDATKLYYVFFYLEETAYAWTQLCDNQSTTLVWCSGSLDEPGFVEQFRLRFCTLYWIEIWDEELLNTVQDSNESVESFCYRVRRLCQRINSNTECNDLLQRLAIYRGARKELISAAKLQLKQSLTEMISRLGYAEKNYIRSNPVVKQDKHFTYDKPHSTTCLATIAAPIVYSPPLMGVRRYSKESRRAESVIDPVEAFLATL